MKPSESRLVVTARLRAEPRLDEIALDPAPEDPSIDSLRKLGSQARGPRVLVGGEPTLRADLPELIAALDPELLECDGLALVREGAIRPLVGAGLRRVRFALHAARPEAHDFLVGRKGAARAVVRAIGRSKALGLGVELVATVTRPTLALSRDLIDVAASLGVSSVLFRRLVERGRALDEIAMLAPRFAFAESALADAVALADRRAIGIAIEGFPACSARSFAGARRAAAAIEWLLPDAEEWRNFRAELASAAAPGCSTCPGLPECAGLPRHYVARFGTAELEKPESEDVVISSDTAR